MNTIFIFLSWVWRLDIVEIFYILPYSPNFADCLRFGVDGWMGGREEWEREWYRAGFVFTRLSAFISDKLDDLIRKRFPPFSLGGLLILVFRKLLGFNGIM